MAIMLVIFHTLAVFGISVELLTIQNTQIVVLTFCFNNREEYFVFSLDECSDIEPISEEEEEEVDTPDCTVLVSVIL